MNGKRIQYFLAATVIGAIICISPVAVWAWSGASGTGESCFSKRLDLNGDGLISADEFAGGTEERFKRLDANGDGYLDATETRRHPRGAKLKKMLAKFDTDGDGQLSSEEFPGPADHFARLDTDGDSFLSAAELRAGKPRASMGRKGHGMCAQMGYGLKNDDADQDGMISRAEFGGPAECFNSLDADNDGFITSEEARARNPKGCPGVCAGSMGCKRAR